HPPANWTDWEAYVDSLFAPGQPSRALIPLWGLPRFRWDPSGDGFRYPDHADRLTPYIATPCLHPAVRNRSVAVYDGAGTLIRLSQSRTRGDQDVYHNLTSALNGSRAPTDSRGSRL